MTWGAILSSQKIVQGGYWLGLHITAGMKLATSVLFITDSNKEQLFICSDRGGFGIGHWYKKCHDFFYVKILVTKTAHKVVLKAKKHRRNTHPTGMTLSVANGWFAEQYGSHRHTFQRTQQKWWDQHSARSYLSIFLLESVQSLFEIETRSLVTCRYIKGNCGKRHTPCIIKYDLISEHTLWQ